MPLDGSASRCGGDLDRLSARQSRFRRASWRSRALWWVKLTNTWADDDVTGYQYATQTLALDEYRRIYGDER